MEVPIPLAALTQGQIVALQFAGAGILVLLTALVMKLLERMKRERVEKEIESLKKAAEAEAAKIVAQAQAQAQSEFRKKREEFDADTKANRGELRAEEKRLSKREDLIDQKLDTLNSKERTLEAGQKAVLEKEKALAGKDRQLNELIARQKSQLLKVANLSMEEARSVLLGQVEKDMERETAELITRRLEEAKETAEAQSREVVITALQRYAAEHTCENTVSTVDIPSDDMKGRVIGREGRNIRAFEKATGVDVIVDDTPGMVVVSGFSPVRREVARQSMERLIQDGRIHPSRIEELVAQTRNDVNHKVLQLGKDAAVETNVRGLNNKLLSLLGALTFRTSYGQNVLRHSVEVAFLGQVMADELGLDGSIARRAGLLHDIGKAMDHDVEGSHPDIGANYLKRFNESPIILNAVAGHHGDVPPDNPYTPLVAAADAISASRPGARRETLERYIKRLEKLEEIATSFTGIETAYAIQAGREIRVIADANQIDDECAMKVARDIANKVEQEMTYPGEIQVTLLREVRCIEYAK